MKYFGKNVVIATALVAAGFLAAWLRFRPYLANAGEYTDGVTTFESDDVESVRYAVWDAPAFLPGSVNQSSRESRPALSADGRWLVFEVGERGLNTELYVAELVDGVPRDAQRLAGVDGPSDDCAPAFRGDELYFASDRAGGAGGLDLYRASFRDARASAPERLRGALNSSADDTDPAPRPGSDTLVFATNRGSAGFELYEASPDEGDDWHAKVLSDLDTLADEREASFTADGRTLFFASDRAGGAGDFDLYRATRIDGGWSEPVALAGLNTPGAERAPLAAFDDFSLYFARETPERGLDLARARSLELFRRAAEPVGWLELVVLASLLLAALLAWLAKRWPRLETLYKCYLVSLVAHLLLLWLFQGLFVGSSTAKRSGKRDGFHVRVESTPRTPSAATRELAGELERSARGAVREVELVRRELDNGALDPRTAPDAPVAIAAPTPAALSTPTRGAAEVVRAPTVAAVVELAVPNDAPTPRTAAAEELALAARTDEAARSDDGASQPMRGRVQLAEASHDAPETLTRLDGPRRAESARPERAELSPATHGDIGRAAEIALAAPSETLVKRAGSEQRELSLEPFDGAAGTAGASGERATTSTAPERGEPVALRDVDSAQPVTAPTLAVGPRELDAPIARAGVALAPEVRTAAPVGLRVEAPAERRSVRVASEASADLLDGVGESANVARPAEPLAGEPRRFELAPADSTEAPAPTGAVAFEPIPRSADEPPRPTKSLDDTPFKNRNGADKTRALELYGGSRETEAAVANGLAYLARIQRPSGEWGEIRVHDDKYGQVAIGKTGLALLAFLGAGHTQASKTEHSDVVGRALEFLIAAQDPESGHFGDCDAYGHGIATYALSECYALTGEAALRAPLERAVRHILANQNQRRDARLFGGWSYYYADGHVFDRWPRTAITVWQVMALESARLAGLEVPRKVFDDARTFLEHARDPDAPWYRYNHDPARLNSGWPTLPASTPAAMFALALFGEDLTAPKYDEPRRFVLERAPRDYRRGSDDDFVLRGQGNLYFWYYGTLAMFRTGGDAWKRWNAAMKDALVRGQRPDGSWVPIDVYAGYARDDDGDRSYSTAMCVLSLEVYYRYYLPLLQVR